jgi:hypothetical protein
MADNEVENPRKSRRDRLAKLREQVAAMGECESGNEQDEGGSRCLAEELHKIKEHIRKRDNEAILAPCTK